MPTPNVSLLYSDHAGTDQSTIVDSALTLVIGGNDGRQHGQGDRREGRLGAVRPRLRGCLWLPRSALCRCSPFGGWRPVEALRSSQQLPG
jgi:hypothetical protein